MKAESLVIVEQHATVNTFPSLVHTARQAMGIAAVGEKLDVYRAIV